MLALAERALHDPVGLDILVNCIGDAIRGSVADRPDLAQATGCADERLRRRQSRFTESVAA